MGRDASADESRTPRIAELDGLRGIAVLMVLAWHYLGALINPSIAPWAKATARTLILGRTGVDLFFVLSGFLITGIILDRRATVARFLASFYLRRSLRIWPAYLLLVALFWLGVAGGLDNSAFNSDISPIRHLTFTQNEWMAEHRRWGADAISVTWSVAIEEWYYLFAPLVLLCVPLRWIPALLLCIALASGAARAWMYAETANSMRAYVSTPFRLDGLALGGVVAWAWRDARARDWLDGHIRVLVGVTLSCVAAVPLLAVLIAHDFARHMFTWAHSYLAVFYSLVLATVLTLSGRHSVSLLRHPALQFVGDISYATYLFHPFVLSCAFLLARRPEHITVASDAWVVAAALIVTLLFCWASRRFLERPLIRFGHSHPY